MAITGWIGMSRIVRGQILKLKNQEYVLASRTLGATNTQLIMKALNSERNGTNYRNDNVYNSKSSIW